MRERMTVAEAFDSEFTPKEVLNIITALNMHYCGEFESVHNAMSVVLDERRFIADEGYTHGTSREAKQWHTPARRPARPASGAG